MGEQRVADLTVSELKALIAQVLDERLQNGQQAPLAKDSRSVKEILDDIAKHAIKPLPGEPTGSEMIIKERERWRQGM